MSAADDAYAAAEKEVSRLLETEEVRLDLHKPDYWALKTLPPRISDLGRLRTARLDHTQISRLDPISRLIALKTLTLSDTLVLDLSPLSTLRALQALDFDHTAISDLAPIAELTALQEISAHSTLIRDLSHLSKMASLIRLNISSTPVSDLQTISDLVSIRELIANNTQVKNVSSLAKSSTLHSIHLENTFVEDLRPLRDLHSLGTRKYSGLWFVGTPFANATDETRRLATIAEDQQRTRETLAFLNTLPPYPEPLPWEVGHHPSPEPSEVKTAKAQIDHLLKNALVTRITAGQFADQIETALAGVPATCGNELAPPLQTMAEVAQVLRRLATPETSDDAILERAALKLRIGQLEALVDRLTQQLSDEKLAREAAEALAKKDGFAHSFRKGAGAAAGAGAVALIGVAVPSAFVYFLGVKHPAVQSVLTVLGRLPD